MSDISGIIGVTHYGHFFYPECRYGVGVIKGLMFYSDTMKFYNVFLPVATAPNLITDGDECS